MNYQGLWLSRVSYGFLPFFTSILLIMVPAITMCFPEQAIHIGLFITQAIVGDGGRGGGVLHHSYFISEETEAWRG